MRHLNAKAYLNRSKSHRRALMMNLAFALFERKRITTTLAKARAARSYAERLITKARKGDLASRRLVLAEIPNKELVKHLFEEIAPRFKDRPGGYTRIIKLEVRPGDAAPMAYLELVGYDEEIMKAIQERLDAKEKIKQEEKKPAMARGKVDKSKVETTSDVEKATKKRWPRGKWHPGAKKGSKKQASPSAESK